MQLFGAMNQSLQRMAVEYKGEKREHEVKSTPRKFTGLASCRTRDGLNLSIRESRGGPLKPKCDCFEHEISAV